MAGFSFSRGIYWNSSAPIPFNDGDYTGLDRLGRIKEIKWNNGSYDTVGFEYGYDRRNNRLFEKNTFGGTTGASPVAVDALLEYDNLNRLVDFQRGTLNGGNDAITSANLTQDWTLDQTGNWDSFNQAVDNPVSQSRTHNAVNELTVSGGGWANPDYDANGNMTLIPQPDNLLSNYTAVWDAWNRLVELKDGNDTVAQYQYDALNRRIIIRDFSSGSLTATNHLYLSSAEQVLEERVDSSSNPSKQFIWGLKFVDDLILRDRDTGGGTLDERLYGLHDLRYSIVAVADETGSVVERYTYDAYGCRKVLAGDFTSQSSTSYDWQFAYTGRRLDAVTGIYYFRRRYYHSKLGRFVSRDSLRLR